MEQGLSSSEKIALSASISARIDPMVDRVSAAAQSAIAGQGLPNGVCLAMCCLWIDKRLKNGLIGQVGLMTCIGTARCAQNQMFEKMALGQVDAVLRSRPFHQQTATDDAFRDVAKREFNLAPKASAEYGLNNSVDGLDQFQSNVQSRIRSSANAFLPSIDLDGGRHAMAFLLASNTALFLDPNFWRVCLRTGLRLR